MTDNIVQIDDYRLQDILVVHDDINDITHIVAIKLLKKYINGEIEADYIEDFDGLFRAICNSYLSMLLGDE